MHIMRHWHIAVCTLCFICNFQEHHKAFHGVAAILGFVLLSVIRRSSDVPLFLAQSLRQNYLTELHNMASTEAMPHQQGGSKASVGDPATFGVVTISDRASGGGYSDLSGPVILQFLAEAVHSQ